MKDPHLKNQGRTAHQLSLEIIPFIYRIDKITHGLHEQITSCINQEKDFQNHQKLSAMLKSKFEVIFRVK